MECEKASRRLRHLLRHAEKSGVTTRDLARLPAVTRLLSRGQGRNVWILWPAAGALLLFVLYCYCSQSNTALQQPMTGHYDDMANLST